MQKLISKPTLNKAGSVYIGLYIPEQSESAANLSKPFPDIHIPVASGVTHHASRRRVVLHVEQRCPPRVAAQLMRAAELLPKRTAIEARKQCHEEEHGHGQDGGQADNTMQIHERHIEVSVATAGKRISNLR